MYYRDQVVLNLENHFLHEGLPQRKLNAVIRTPDYSPGKAVLTGLSDPTGCKNLIKLTSSSEYRLKREGDSSL